MVVAPNSPAPDDAWWGFLTGPRPDPKVIQAVVAGFVGLDLLARELSGAGYAAQPWPAAGLLLVAAATVVSLLVPWQRVPLWALGILPMLDIAALGLTRLTEVSSPSIVVLLPAVWLARQFGRRGVVLAIVAVSLLQSLPGLLYRGVDPTSTARALLLPLVAGAAAQLVSIALDTLRARGAEAEERGRELRAALDEARRRQHLNQAVLDTVDVGVVVLGPDGTYQSTNRQHAEFMTLGFPAGHGGVAGETGDVFGEDGTTRLGADEMASAMALRGEEFRDRRIWTGADPAQRRAFSVSARSMREPDGRFAGAVLAYTDVTDLLRALQVKDEFVATVSHELRTPLTSIIGYVDMLQERDDLGSQAERQLAVVYRNSERLMRLVDDLLHTAQLAGGGAELCLAPCHVDELARDAAAAAAPAAAEKGVTITTDLVERLPVRIDCTRIGQVLDNLLSNAVNYNRPGGEIRVGLAHAGDTAQIEVRDTGMGLLPEERAQLFTRFYRGRHAVDHAIPGAGLGLCISKAIVEAHGGRIEVESEADVGTVVRVRLPRLSLVPETDVAEHTPPDLAVGHG